MSSTEELVASDSSNVRRFVTTHWSVVLEAGCQKTDQSNVALSTLCETYWYPLYAYVRRQGHQPAEAQDLVQEFFTRLLEKDYLQSADQERGRFRSFLLTILKRFLSNEKKRADAQKRGGGQVILSLDFGSGEERLRLEPADDRTPERLFNRQWVLTLLDHVLSQLGQDYAAKGKTAIFDRLKVYLAASSNTPSYAELSEELEMSESAVKVAVHRLRERYRNILRAEIANTVASDNEVDDELNYLLESLRM